MNFGCLALANRTSRPERVSCATVNGASKTAIEQSRLSSLLEVPEGYQDEAGFHYGYPAVESGANCFSDPYQF